MGTEQPCKVNCLRQSELSRSVPVCVPLCVCVWMLSRNHRVRSSPFINLSPPLLKRGTIDAWCRQVMVHGRTYFVWRRYRSRWRCPLKCYRSHRWHMTHRLSPVRGTGTERSESVWVQHKLWSEPHTHTHTLHTVTAVCQWLTNCSSRQLSVPLQ